VAYWRANGAKLSDTVSMLVERAARGGNAPAAATEATAAPKSA